MHGRLLVPAVTLAALALATAPATARTITLTQADDGTTVTARAGDTVRIALEANQTTGYRWTITTRPARRVAVVRSARYVAPESGLPGQGGSQRYVLSARRHGRTAFAARYSQVGSGAVGETFSVKLRVRPRLS